MPSLLDLKTDLKSLRFGRDKQGGGSSNQPYIVTPIPTGDTTGADMLYGNFLLRGGALRPTLVARGESRLLKFLSDTDNPNGASFVAKQVLLARLNPKTAGQPNRVYSPLNTIAQVADPTGTVHFNKDGFNLTTPYNQTYERITSIQNTFASGRNRLVNLTNNKISGTSSDINFQYGITPFQSNILTYGGGAGSVGGFGTTNIKRYTSTNQNNALINLGNGVNGDRFLSGILNTTLTNRGIENLPLFSGTNTKIYKYSATTQLTDFRRQVVVNNPLALTKLVSTSYQRFNRQSTYGITDSGNRSFTRINQYEGTRNPSNFNKLVSDPVSMKPIYSSTKVANDMLNSDFIKFWIAVLDNDSTEGKKEYIHLRPYLSMIDDSFQASFNDFNYVGRAETFQTYKSFSRDFNFSLKIAALSKEELLPLINKVNQIASLTAPNYSSGGFMRSNIVYLTLGDYLDNVPGFIQSVNITIPDDTSWEIARKSNILGGSEVDTSTEQLPKYIEMQITFKPIHSVLPEKGAKFIGKTGITGSSPANSESNTEVEE